MVVAAFVGGVVGGVASHRLAAVAPVFAAGYKDVNIIKADVVEAKEFRVVDDRGWLLTKLYHHAKREPSIASIDFMDGRPGQKNRLHLSIHKDSIKMLDPEGNVVWSAP